MPEYNEERITQVAEKIIMHLHEEGCEPADIVCALGIMKDKKLQGKINKHFNDAVSNKITTIREKIMEVMDGEKVDLASFLTALDTLQTFALDTSGLEKDLEKARYILDLNKSKILSNLAARGWK